MSDHDKFKDFLPPGNNFELPDRTKMFPEFNKIFKKHCEKAIDEMRKTVHPEHADEFEERVQKQASTEVQFKPSQKFKVEIDGSDEIEFAGMFSTDDAEKGGKYATVSIDLFKNGEPLNIYGTHGNSAVIAISPDPEEPPFVYSFEDWDNVSNSAGVPEVAIAHLKETRLQEGHPVTELSDSQCAAVLDALALAEPDAEDTLHDVLF